MTPAARAAIAAITVLGCVFAADAAAARAAKKQFWGAIAYSSKSGAYGYAVDMKSKRDAEAEAFRQCRSDCDVIKSFRNNCGAVARKERRFSFSLGATRQIAEQKALEKCGSSGCSIMVWACTSEK